MFFLRAGGVSLPDGRYEARGERVLGEPEQQACLADALVRASEMKKFRRESTSQSWLPARAKLTKPPGSFGLFAPHPLQQSVLVRPPSRACPVRACVRCMNIILTRVPDDQELDDVVIVLPLARHRFFFFWSSLVYSLSSPARAKLCWAVTFESFPLHHHKEASLRSARPSGLAVLLGFAGGLSSGSRGRGSRSRSPGLAPCALSPTPPVLTLASHPSASGRPPKEGKSWTTFPSSQIRRVRFGWNRSRSRRTHRQAGSPAASRSCQCAHQAGKGVGEGARRGVAWARGRGRA